MVKMKNYGEEAKMVALFAISVLLVLQIVMPLAFAQETIPQGPWVDEIVFFEEPSEDKVVDMLLKGDVDIYLYNIRDPKLFETIRNSPNLAYKVSFGMYNELTFNPAEFKTGFNPFTNKRIREAMNYIVDREYVAKELWQGMGKPKWVSYISAFPEYGRIADTIKMLESKYKYDFDKGKNIVYEEMAKMGAELKEGKWYYEGEPVVIKVVIRIEDQRKLLGDYFAGQLEKLGFTVDRLFKSRKEASPIVFAGDPTLGQWNVYTGGWIATSVSIDDSGDIGYYYTPLGYGAYIQYAKPDPILYEIASKLWSANWKTWEERLELMARGTELALEDSLRIFVVEEISPWVSRADMEGAADLAGGFATALWSRTVRYKGRVGGTVRAASIGMLVDPWNPIAGTNWLYDSYVLNAVNDFAMVVHPYTGVYLMDRVSNYTIEQPEGGVVVPSDAYFAWDPKEQKWVKAPPGTVAKVKVTARFDTLGKYQDGSDIKPYEWLSWAFNFERAEPTSPWYDDSYVGDFEEWRSNFRGMRIVKESPLTLEYYINYTNPEPSYVAAWAIGWPNTPWHALAIGMLAEQDGKAAFSDYKAGQLKVDWLNYIGGTTLATLAEELDKAISTKYVPAWLKEFVTPDEAVARYQNLKTWYNNRGHFWVATGPYYLDRADFTAHQAVVKAWREYPLKADKFAFLAEPPVPVASITVPESVVPGLETRFSVKLTYKEQPYPTEKISFVKYLVTDPKGEVIIKGAASATSEAGVFNIVLTPTETGSFVPGVYTLSVIATSTEIATPATVEKQFSVIPAISHFELVLSQARSELSARIDSLESSVQSFSGEIQALQGNVSTLTGLAAISVVIALISIALQFIRKPK